MSVDRKLSTDPTWLELFKGPGSAVFAVLCFGVWLHAADGTVIATLMPSVVNEIGGETLISWNFVLYRLASIVAACSGALMVRNFGLRKAMVLSSLLVSLGCVISAVTPTMLGMLIGRTCQGLGGGFLVAMVTIGAANLFPSNATPRVMAAISAVWGSSAFLGPLVGGFFAEIGEWRWGFWAFAAQGIGLALLLWFVLPENKVAEKAVSKFPIRRLTVLSAAVMAIAIASLETGNTAFVVVLISAGLVGFILFLRLDYKAGDDTRFLPKDISNLSHISGAGFTALFLAALSTMAFTVYGPVLIHQIYGLGPLATGYMIAVESVSWTVGALLFANWKEQRQIFLIRLGFFLIFLSATGLALSMPNGPVSLVIIMLALAGFGFGAMFGHLLQCCVEASPIEDKDRAAGAIATVQAIGYAFGAAICGLAVNAAGYGSSPGLETAKLAAFWGFVVLIPPAFIAVLLSFKVQLIRS